ncbi:MAG: flagellar hook-associated protein FlgK [Alphaproteobacteria bacterium]|nr:flagellar hook-associated protein FlgK [Alphaproteobacteria bacterium]MCD8571660.1 flagellar hook-associated protein FlgK [Alphaproteobacteria bacterium]
MGLAGMTAALSGLRASQQQINLIANNVSNANTPGYTRKILPQESQAINGVTVGVLTGTFTRNVDLNLQRDLWTQISSVSELDIQQTYLNRIEEFHGDPALELSVAAEIAALRDIFAALADSPEDGDIQTEALNHAIDTVNKINDFASMLDQLRNDAQDEISISVGRANQLLEIIADTNRQIQANLNIDRPIAALEDTRDGAVKELSTLIEISTFRRGDGVLVIQTNEGVQLADQTAEQLTFRPLPMSATTYYPDSAAGLYVGDPAENIVTAVDIADDFPGGKIGGLLKLRDTILPRQTAQLDELAHKLALRFDAQGLRLFTDSAGGIPLDTAPNPTTVPPTAVPYVGFASEIRVNQLVLNDKTLLQAGTYGATPQPGSNEVIRRVLEFAFGSVQYQEAYNSDTTTGVDLENTGGVDLQNWMGLFSSNSITGGRDLTVFADVATLVASATPNLDPPNDEFEIIFTEPRLGYTDPPIARLTISLTNAQLQAGATAADQIAAEINAQIAANLAAAEITDMQPAASVGPNGEILITSRGSIEVDSTTLATGMTQTGLDYLGLSDSGGTPKEPIDPYFDVQVGNDQPVRVYLEPGETSVTLLAKLNAIPNLVADYDANGYLQMRPGDDPLNYATQSFGGDIKIIGGAYATSGAAYGTPPALGTRAAIDDGVNIASALFGTYSINAGIVNNQTPVTSYFYGSPTDGSLATPPNVSFRESYLGPGADTDTNITGSSTLIDFAQKIISRQSLDLLLIQNQQKDETALQTVLEEQFLSESGVNLDEEMANLIVYQTSYAAAARVVSAVDELFKELLNVI